MVRACMVHAAVPAPLSDAPWVRDVGACQVALPLPVLVPLLRPPRALQAHLAQERLQLSTAGAGRYRAPAQRRKGAKQVRRDGVHGAAGARPHMCGMPGRRRWPWRGRTRVHAAPHRPHCMYTAPLCVRAGMRAACCTPHRATHSSAAMRSPSCAFSCASSSCRCLSSSSARMRSSSSKRSRSVVQQQQRAHVGGGDMAMRACVRAPCAPSACAPGMRMHRVPCPSAAPLALTARACGRVLRPPSCTRAHAAVPAATPVHTLGPLRGRPAPPRLLLHRYPPSSARRAASSASRASSSSCAFDFFFFLPPALGGIVAGCGAAAGVQEGVWETHQNTDQLRGVLHAGTPIALRCLTQAPNRPWLHDAALNGGGSCSPNAGGKHTPA